MNRFRSGGDGVGGGLQCLGGHLLQLTAQVGPLLHPQRMQMVFLTKTPDVTPGALFLHLLPIFVQRKQRQEV